eukprot:TRINITY_DN22852_c0_g1_i2.p1 TRINITY_DN22852_c0_g1~~TRINITY_DN22852_c0_g1_i2.p1  ORF type:complete len:424 (+),score=67.68 TRINITY_DN22852_c0_g1_i2:45-1316(+)
MNRLTLRHVSRRVQLRGAAFKSLPTASAMLRGGHMTASPCLRPASQRHYVTTPSLDTRTSQRLLLHPAAVVGLAGAAAWAAQGDRKAPAKASDDLSHELTAEEQRTVKVFEHCCSSVVHINTFAEQEAYRMVPGRGFGHLQLDLQEIPQGSGSGFAWDSEHIVTNFHVIKDADRATVTLSDHTSCEASLVGVEPDCDLAVLRLERPAKGSESKKVPALTPLARGRSSNLHVGQKVLAIGNPFGLDQTLTSGIVSGLGREMKGVSGRTIRGLIQTDAAINPGNSGGPLLNAKGVLVGVNTMIASPSGAFAGVGFAIPIDAVTRVVQQIVKYGHTKKAYFGVYCVPDQITRRLATQIPGGLEGVLALQIEPGSPAAEAGVRPTVQTRNGIRLGDEVVAFNGKKVTSVENLMETVEQHMFLPWRGT